MGAAVVSCCDPAPVLEPAEHAFDPVALLVDLLVIFDRLVATRTPRDAGLDADTCQSVTEPIAVIALVGDEHVGHGQGWQHGRRTAIVTHLAFGQQQDQRLAVGVANGVQFGVQAAFGASNTAGNIPFLSRLAAVRWALRWVASIMTVPVASLRAASVEKIRSKTPALLQRMKRL
jgi:hypothetical protein